MPPRSNQHHPRERNQHQRMWREGAQWLVRLSVKEVKAKVKEGMGKVKEGKEWKVLSALQ